MIARVLEDLGIAGAIISVLMATISVLAGVIAAQWRHSNKVYGYRLAERDSYNKAVSDSTQVLQSMLHTQADRNTVIDEQAELIAKQAVALEMLRVVLVSQYENIKDHQSRLDMAVSAIAEAMRVLTGMVTDNRGITSNYVAEVKNAIVAGNQSMISELNRRRKGSE